MQQTHSDTWQSNVWPVLKLIISCFLPLGFTLAWTALAQANNPGDLDVTFGGTGIVTNSLTGTDASYGIAIQADNKLVVTGNSQQNSGPAQGFTVVRYNTDGTLDTTFNQTGVVTTIISHPDISLSIAVQPDQKIVVAGGTDGGMYSNIMVVRYTTTGTLDSSFNSTGIVTTPIPNGASGATAIIVQPDGKVIVGGVSGATDDSDFTLVRYTITGTLDTTFNQTGIVTTSIPPQAIDNGIASLTLQPDGKIIAVGESGNDFAMVRYTITGAVDTSFGGTGIITTSALTIGYDVALQSDGKIVASGWQDSSNNRPAAAIRYLPNGSLDTTFGNNGIVISTLDTGLIVTQPNNKIVIAGSDGQYGDNRNFAIIRYHDNGTIDTSFGGTGIITTAITDITDVATALLIQPNGKLVLSGYSNSPSNLLSDNQTSDFTVVRYIGDDYFNLTKTIDNAAPQAGEVITYTLTINNPSVITATNTLISDTLPVSLTLAGPVTINPARPDAILATSPLSLPVLAQGITLIPNETITLTVPVTVSNEIQAGLWLTNTATVTSNEITIPAVDTALIQIPSRVTDATYLPIILKNTTPGLSPE
ncbi:MAG: hypothetical protein AAF485_07385 [Chloroflexota bacterium]